MTRRRLQWTLPESPPPAHPYRDTLLVYGFLAVAIVLISWATGGNVRKAILIAALAFVVAFAWSSVRWRRRIREYERERALEEEDLLL
jgi:membrane protein implicated in regulation of membrane protease activity